MQTPLVIGVAALVAALYGFWHGRATGTPLFFRIVTFGVACYALGTCYDVLKGLVIESSSLPSLALAQQAAEASASDEAVMPLLTGASGFTVGLIGYAGMFCFILSSYVGALDSLADGREARYRRYRLGALTAPVLIVCMAGVLSAAAGAMPFLLAVLVPVASTSYFAAKHLVMPDVELGIIRVMRPYNACMLVLCLLQPCILLVQEGPVRLIAAALAAAATLSVLPLAAKGVRKWFQ